MIIDEEGRAPLQLTHQMRLLINLVHLKAKHEEMEAIKKDVHLKNVIANIASLKGSISPLHRAETQARAFYRGSAKRDEALLARMLDGMSRAGEKRAVLFCGGYHSEVIQSRLREPDISHDVLIPRIEGPKTNEAYFDSVLHTDAFDLETLWKHVPGTLASPRYLSMTDDPLEPMAGKRACEAQKR